MTSVRINKYLSEVGLMSRRKADDAIINGQISVNGKIVTELGIKINPERDCISYRGKEIPKQLKYFIYYALNKPKGIISTANDEQGRKTVVDLVPRNPRVYPVGRLDANSEGLILLTNDGELTQQLTHPKYQHQKEYFVVAKNNRGIGPKQAEAALKKGIRIRSELMKADTAKVKESDNKYFEIELVLHTGHNRQIRRMCDKIGLEVIKLIRVRIGQLLLRDLNLKSGEYKIISKNQII